MEPFFALALSLGLVILAWTSARAAAETAIWHGRRACREADVQWLDQSVHLTRMRLRRDRTGRLGVERHYRFEYSRGGDDRQAGRIVLHGRSLVSLAGPLPEPRLEGTT